MSHDKDVLHNLLPKVEHFLCTRLHLALHPDKVHLKTLASGVDFLGWVHFPDHSVLRTATKRRMFKNMKEKEGEQETVQAYVGMLRFGNAKKLKEGLHATSRFMAILLV